jgi:ribulose-5-phosphate 4-epimerase/fuculose-1-phosphate aldolase
MDTSAVKQHIVTAIRMLEHAGLVDMNGHVSYRLPGTDRVLINSRAASRASLTVDDIVTIDLDGNLLEGEVEPPSEYHIHTGVYRVRSDVNTVLHNHPHWQTILGIAGVDMQPVFSIGSFVDPGMPVFEKASLVNTRELGDELAATLGDHTLASIRHHGSVLVEDEIEALFARAVFVEDNAQKQYYASLLGNVVPLTGENLDRTRSTNWQPSIARKVWHYHEEKARLEGKLPD